MKRVTDWLLGYWLALLFTIGGMVMAGFSVSRAPDMQLSAGIVLGLSFYHWVVPGWQKRVQHERVAFAEMFAEAKTLSIRNRILHDVLAQHGLTVEFEPDKLKEPEDPSAAWDRVFDGTVH